MKPAVTSFLIRRIECELSHRRYELRRLTCTITVAQVTVELTAIHAGHTHTAIQTKKLLYFGIGKEKPSRGVVGNQECFIMRSRLASLTSGQDPPVSSRAFFPLLDFDVL